MDDYNDSALDHLNSLSNDLRLLKENLESLERDLRSLESSYKDVSNRYQCEEQGYADLKKCAEDYKFALEHLLEKYGDLLTRSFNSEESEADIKKRIQDELGEMRNSMADRHINLQYQFPGEKYAEPTVGESSFESEYTTREDLDGVVIKIISIGLNSKNIRGDREIRESTKIYRYRDSSDSSISDTSAKEGAPTTDSVISKQSSADSNSRNTGVGSGNQEETSHEADSTNQTDENRHVLADVDAPLYLIGRDQNSDGKYELPLDESIQVGISDCKSPIARIKVNSVATDIKITLTEDDTSLSLEITPEGNSLVAEDEEISYGKWFLEKKYTGCKGTNVTYKKIDKHIERYARVTNIENAKDVKLEETWESPIPFIRVDDDEFFYYHPSMDEPHWREEPTESVLKLNADYTKEDFDRHVCNLYNVEKSKDRVVDKIHKEILPGGKPITKKFIKDKVNQILQNLKKSRFGDRI